jgi:hypothetical protein
MATGSRSLLLADAAPRESRARSCGCGHRHGSAAAAVPSRLPAGMLWPTSWPTQDVPPESELHTERLWSIYMQQPLALHKSLCCCGSITCCAQGWLLQNEHRILAWCCCCQRQQPQVAVTGGANSLRFVMQAMLQHFGAALRGYVAAATGAAAAGLAAAGVEISLPWVSVLHSFHTSSRPRSPGGQVVSHSWQLCAYSIVHTMHQVVQWLANGYRPAVNLCLQYFRKRACWQLSCGSWRRRAACRSASWQHMCQAWFWRRITWLPCSNLGAGVA